MALCNDWVASEFKGAITQIAGGWTPKEANPNNRISN